MLHNNNLTNPKCFKTYSRGGLTIFRHAQINAWDYIGGELWIPLVQYINQTLQQISYQINFVSPFNNIYKDINIVIHYRLGDTPFIRNNSYELLCFNWYLNAIKMINEKSNNKILIITNYTRSNKHIDLSRLYLNEFVNFLESNNNSIIIKDNGTIEQDFFTLMHAPAYISSHSSFGWFAGMSASTNQKFIFPTTKPEIKHNYRKNMIPLPGIFLKHSEVPDYYNIDNVFKILNCKY